MGYTLKEAIERSELIDEKGYLLDDGGNLLLDENGQETIINKRSRKYFKILGV